MQRLLELCLSYLFGNGMSLDASRELGLVSSGLVTIFEKPERRYFSLKEPVVLNALLKYLADQDHGMLMWFFSNLFFSPQPALNLSSQVKGQLMETALAFLGSSVGHQASIWYFALSIKGAMHVKTIEEKKSIHLNFELADVPSTLQKIDQRWSAQDENVNCVNLDSQFANDFFGEHFVEQFRVTIEVIAMLDRREE